MLGDKLAALGEADDSVEKREESHGDERAGRLIRVRARGDPRGTFCENHVRELRTFFTVVLEPNIHTFSVLSETLSDFLKSKLC